MNGSYTVFTLTRKPLNEECRKLRLKARAVANLLDTMGLALTCRPKLVVKKGHAIPSVAPSLVTVERESTHV